jgi:alkylresorcinol/alkylpyrone synthase
MTLSPRLSSLAVAVPPHVLETSLVVQQAGRIFARFGEDFERMLPVFANTGIARRYSACPPGWFNALSNWAERSEIFLDVSQVLFREVAAKAIAAAGIAARDVDAIITVSSTGIATPTIEARVMHDMGFRDDVMRVPVFGLGCAGGLTGLSLAGRLSRAMPGKTVLLVVIELCTLAFRPDEMSKSNIIASALFGDGAAAAIIRDQGEGPVLEHQGEHTWPDTTGVMGWRVDKEGFGAIFARSIPDLALNDLRPAADGFLARHGLTMADIDHYSFHPGGTKVIQALEQAFELQQGLLQNERNVLAGFGNMSAPTVLFVLQRDLEQPWTGRRFLGSLGPGFTASFLTMTQ